MSQGRTHDHVFRWRWPAIIVVVGLMLVGLQVLRVNQPRPVSIPAAVMPYSTPGPVIQGDLSVPPKDFHSVRLNLNRSAKLSGNFRTGSIKARTSVLVVPEEDFERWKVGLDHRPVVETGYVPGGKISPVLQPGIYYLVVDNRLNDVALQLRADFSLE